MGKKGGGFCKTFKIKINLKNIPSNSEILSPFPIVEVKAKRGKKNKKKMHLKTKFSQAKGNIRPSWSKTISIISKVTFNPANLFPINILEIFSYMCKHSYFNAWTKSIKQGFQKVELFLFLCPFHGLTWASSSRALR